MIYYKIIDCGTQSWKVGDNMKAQVNKLRLFREQAGYTQLEMSKLMGISESYYCQLENGVRRMSLDNARKAAIILNKTLDDIFFADNLAKCQPTGTEGGNQ